LENPGTFPFKGVLVKSASAPPENDAAAEKEAGAAEAGLVKTRYLVENMDCPVEERLIREKLQGLFGAERLEFNLLQRVLTVFSPPDRPDLPARAEAILRSIDMEPVLLKEDAAPPKERRHHWGRIILASLLALGSEILHLQGFPLAAPAALAVLAALLAGFSTYRKGLAALWRRELNMNALMTVAITGAVLLGDFPEAAMVLALFTLAEELEERSLSRARAAISGLMSLAPDRATVERADGTFEETPAAEIPIGSLVRVRPGEKLSLDGRIVKGRSTLNEAPITGESKPAEKGPGDVVFAGTVNESGSFVYAATEPYANSTLSRILKAVEEAQSSRAPIQRFVDKFAAVYTPAVFGLALLVAILPPLAFGGEWSLWIYRALVTLVVACPCALVISTPVTIVSGLAAATRKGLLIKGGSFLEEGRRLKWLALDKTGTVTRGRPVQTDRIVVAAESAKELEILGASLAFRSDHPVSRAIFTAQGLKETDLRPTEDFRALPGEGVSAAIDGRELFLGNLRLLSRIHGPHRGTEEIFRNLEKDGKSVVALFSREKIHGVFAASDSVRPECAQAVRELEEMGVKTMMLTGDNPLSARRAAMDAGIGSFKSSLLPADKVRIVGELAREGKVGMVGDGINDAPALARADIGFAMGAAGTDAAIETAAVAIMDDDLGKIPAFVKLSRETFWHLWENISFSLVVKLAFLILTFLGHTRMFMAVFADIGVCLIVVANGLRLLKK
jgi:Cd2+/Zn2+-exporting ATPase